MTESGDDDSTNVGPVPRLVYCHCAYAKAVPDAVKRDVLRGLSASGVSFDAVPDLCEMSARKDPALARLVEEDQPVRIAACFPRAVQWLFHSAGSPLPEAGIEIHNMREDTADAVLGDMLEGLAVSADAEVGES